VGTATGFTPPREWDTINHSCEGRSPVPRANTLVRPYELRTLIAAGCPPLAWERLSSLDALIGDRALKSPPFLDILNKLVKVVVKLAEVEAPRRKERRVLIAVIKRINERSATHPLAHQPGSLFFYVFHHREPSR